MNKPEFVAKVADLLDAPKSTTKPYVDAVFDAIIDALAEGETVEISGFGKFETKDSEAHTARNPKTGENVEVEAKKKIRFKVSNSLKSAVNE